MPHIDSTKFGEITVDGKRYHQVIIAGEEVHEREYDRLTDLYGTSHKMGDWEVEELLAGDPEVIVIGTGEVEKLRVDFRLKVEARERGVEVVAAATPEAVKAYNVSAGEGRKVNALIHTTC